MSASVTGGLALKDYIDEQKKRFQAAPKLAFRESLREFTAEGAEHRYTTSERRKSKLLSVSVSRVKMTSGIQEVLSEDEEWKISAERVKKFESVESAKQELQKRRSMAR